jgi:cytochrome P450
MRNAFPVLPPGPRLPGAVQSLIWFRKAQWLLDTCQARFGDMFTLDMGYEGKWVVTSDPDAIKQVFTGNPRLLHAGEANRILLPVLGASSVLLLDDDAHLAQRKLLLPPFHGERMQRYGELMSAVAAREIERWPLDEPHRLRGPMQAMTLEIVLRAVFGISEGPRLENLRSELRRLLDTITKPFSGAVMVALGPEGIMRLGVFRRELERVNRPIYEEIAERRQAGDLAERDDIMSLLLQATHEDGSPMSDEELRDELVTLLVAGHETTANALSWAVERLCRHPRKLGRLTEEVRAGEDAYLKATIQETLRLRPVISIVLRRLAEPMEIGGRMLPGGCSIVPAIHLVHRRGDIYPEPNEFRPERFLEQEGGKAPGTYTWIPFGGGVRRCLGAAFAQFEMECVLRELVLRTTLRASRPQSERIYRRAITETPGRDAEVLVGRSASTTPVSQARAEAVLA